MKPLRIATYNIHKGVSAWALRNRIHDLRIGLASLEADLIFLQEVQELNSRNQRRFADWPAETQTQFLACDDYHCVYGGNAYYDHGHHGNAILARLPFLEFSNHDISDHRFERRGLLHAVLNIDGRPLHVVNFHLGLFAGSRQRQARALIELVSRAVPPQAALILAGDSNDWTQGLNALLLSELKLGGLTLASAKPLLTYPSLLPCLALDRIYVRGFEVLKTQVPRGRRWSRLSDHLPLVAELAWL